MPNIEQLTVNKLTFNTATGLTRSRSRDGAERYSAQLQAHQSDRKANELDGGEAAS